MFFSLDLLVRKKGGVMNVMWLVGNNHKKVSKAMILKQDIIACANNLRDPEGPLALRLVGTLLNGLTRIHLKQVVYTQQKAQEVRMSLVKKAAKSVDLPAETCASGRRRQRRALQTRLRGSSRKRTTGEWMS